MPKNEELEKENQSSEIMSKVQIESSEESKTKKKKNETKGG